MTSHALRVRKRRNRTTGEAQGYGILVMQRKPEGRRREVIRPPADNRRTDETTRKAQQMIRTRGVQRLDRVYEPSWCCRNIPLSVTRLMNVSQSGCSQRRPSHLLLSFTLVASPSLARRVLQPIIPEYQERTLRQVRSQALAAGSL